MAFPILQILIAAAMFGVGLSLGLYLRERQMRGRILHELKRPEVAAAWSALTGAATDEQVAQLIDGPDAPRLKPGARYNEGYYDMGANR